MKLPFLSSLFKSKVQKEYFLAFLLRDEHVHAVVFEQISGRIQVVGLGKAGLTKSIELISQEELLQAADKAISLAEESLPNGIQTHKTIFGVKETWVEDSHITKEYLTKLKQVSEELDLQPIGFLVFPEAIAHLLQREEGAPISGILVDIGEKNVCITLIRAGRIIETKDVTLQDSIVTTVENALKQFRDVEIFPSRLIFFDSQDKSLERKFLSHQWSKTLPFLHVPQVSILSTDFDTRAILYGTATQMGFDAIDLVKEGPKGPSPQLSAVSHKKTVDQILDMQSDQQDLENPEQKTENKDENESMSHLASSKSLDDIEKEKMNDYDTQELADAQSQEYFGFVKDEDIADSQKNTEEYKYIKKHGENHAEFTQELPEEVKDEETHQQALGFSLSGPAFFEGAKKRLSQIQFAFPKHIRRGFSGKIVQRLFSSLPISNSNKIVIILPVVLLFILGIFLWYIFGIHATVVLSLTPKVIEQNQPVTFTTDGSTNVSQNIIAGQTIQVTETGKVSTSTTGSKDVGTAAKGTVTIFNSDDSSHTLNSGTTITSSNGLKFTLDNDVTVASGSSDPTNLSAGTADVSVTSSDIGTDYNLPSDTKFSIAGTSVMAAKNSNAFSGGSKKTITVASQKDLDTLAAQLIQNLESNAKTDLQKQVDGDKIILPAFTAESVTTKNYDKSTGDEAQSVTLNGTVTYESIAYAKSDMDSYTKSAMQGQIPSDLVLSKDGITYTVKDVTVKSGLLKATLDMKASLIPTVDIKSLAQKIAGNPFSEARSILSSTPQFADSTFTLSPNLFFLPKNLPKMAGNIHITITTNE